MAVVTVAADNLRADNMDATTNVTDIGGGAGAGVEPDIWYQKTSGANGAVSRKIGTASRGFYTTTGATRDMTAARRTTAIMKVAIGNWQALDPQTTPGLKLTLGSDASNNREYDSALFTSYQPKGGFMFFAIDPNVAGHADLTNGTPGLTAMDYFAIEADFSATSKTENVVMDAVDIGAGLNLIGGDGVSTDGVFQDFIDADEGTEANRYGYVTSQGGVLFVYGRLWIGQNTSQASIATEFTDSNQTIVFPDGLFNAAFSGMGLDLGSASTIISISGTTFVGRGNETTADTRPDVTSSGTSGSATITSCVFDNFAGITLTSACTMATCVIRNSGQIDTGSGANLAGTTVSSSTATSALLWDANVDPNGELDNVVFESSGTGHAIELGTSTPATITLTGHSYTGYAGTDGSTGNEVIYNNSGKAITITVSGGNTPTIRNGTGASTTVINSVNVTLTGMRDNTEVRVYDSGTGAVIDGIENATSGTTDDRSFTFSDTAGNIVDIRIFNKTYEPETLLDFTIPSTATSIPVQQRFDRNYSNP